MPGLFVTATGTDVGKTYVAAGLIRAGRRAGVTMDALKPLLSGFSDDMAAESDAGVLLQALGRPVTPAEIARISPWRFKAPLSPDMAAAAEGRSLDFATIVAACRAAVRADRVTLIEGIGGVMVPLDSRHTILDVIGALALPVVLVSPTGLGAISHVLTAREALRARNIRARLIVLNETAGSTVPLEATRATLTSFCTDVPLAVVSQDAPGTVFDALLDQLGIVPD